MAIKLKKYPKKPKKTASIATKENYLKRCKEIEKENNRRKAEAKRSETLDKKIANLK